MAAKRHKKSFVRLAEDFRAPIGAFQAAIALRLLRLFVAKPFRVFSCGYASLGHPRSNSDIVTADYADGP
jgi:hypothetical protein